MINTNYNNNFKNAPAFKGIMKYVIKRADLEDAVAELVTKRTQNDKAPFVSFLESPYYHIFERTINKIKQPLDWVVNNLELKGYKLKVPKCFAKREFCLYIIDDKDIKTFKKFFNRLTSIRVGLRVRKKMPNKNQISNEAILLYQSNQIQRMFEKLTDIFIRDKNVETIYWKPKT